jgi:CheY-like chemotaxis protein
MSPKILTVDDSKTVRAIIRKMLSKFSCEVIEAEDGMEGLTKAREENPNLIILDIDMPKMNGLEVLMNLRNDNNFEKTPVFMLTSKSKMKNVRIAMELGVCGYVGKPFKRLDLLDRIRKVLPLSPA